jgi:2,5-diamino-6-(ribosylamino)-4(3H)-pyrimidinone 5'-phosphate reductase
MIRSGSATDRPFVHANCAISLDGRLAYAGGRRARLSGPADLARVQRLRAASDAILVGANTVVRDDPSLRIHSELLEKPVDTRLTRIVFDSAGRIPESARFLDGSLPTIVVMTEEAGRQFPAHVTVLRAGTGRVDPVFALQNLFGHGIRKLLVEGGGQVFASLFRLGLVDRLTVYIAPVLIGGSTAPTMIAGVESDGPDQIVGLERESVEPLDDGILLTFTPRPIAPGGAAPL